MGFVIPRKKDAPIAAAPAAAALERVQKPTIRKQETHGKNGWVQACRGWGNMCHAKETAYGNADPVRRNESAPELFLRAPRPTIDPPKPAETVEGGAFGVAKDAADHQCL